MLDIKLVRNNPELVKENIRKKFQDEKLVMVDEVVAMDKEWREDHTRGDVLRNQRNVLSKQIGGMMARGERDKAEETKKEVKAMQDEMAALEAREAELEAEIRKRMLVIPNIIDESVPIGKDDSENVERERFGEPVVPDYEIPYHVDIMEKVNGIDIDAARRVSRKRLLLPQGGHCPPAQRHIELRARLYDKQGLHLLRAPFHDPQRRCKRRNELCRNGRHDV